MADPENGKKLSPVVADNGPAPVIDLSLDLCVVLEALAVLHGLAEDGVAVAHEGDLHVAGVLGRFCKLPASSGALSSIKVRIDETNANLADCPLPS